MNVKHIILALALFGSLLATRPLNADEPISISVRPTVTVARATAQVKVFVERNDENRTLTWEVDGPTYYRSSTQPLEGSAAPKNWFFFVRDLPEGEFDVRATVTRSNNSESVALTKIIVVAGGQR
jgi:hypothetical protein